MLDSEIYEMLSNLEEKDIKVLISISAIYLSRVYGTSIKQLCKDIKKLEKELR